MKNALPNFQIKKKSISWQCSIFCKHLTEEYFQKLYEIVADLSKIESNNSMIQFISRMNNCSLICSQFAKPGHLLSCVNADDQTAPYVILKNASPHYPQVPKILRNLENFKSSLVKLNSLDIALYYSNLKQLNKFAESSKASGLSLPAQNTTFKNEDEIIAYYKLNFKPTTKVCLICRIIAVAVVKNCVLFQPYL